MNVFKWVCLLTALLFAYLFSLLLFSPDAFLADVGLESTLEANFIAKRTSIFMLGMGLLCLSGIGIKDSYGKSSLSMIMVIVMLGLAILGFYEWNRGVVNEGIFVAVVTELVLLSPIWGFL
ncbi:hypothetical protein [Vibrio sonorensis]|uniref:hypothetical protein n=1 Tax=Vibrio sonorensis TaxID=1004316 RepID=UPI0008D9F821|nr:hypothetical protein [Vibrio sonorensis]